ncbi:hypothetical protein JG687_00005949 [Phytophthora cactorum]|uniref:Uncharacterized protein n=1 Tax=Phytophthora cactorum TaxID=29920 RepID=A0A8T1UJH4_9STRA|nr:hypothetical protein JG687_00005949 [Phytophthora cactorum]
MSSSGWMGTDRKDAPLQLSIVLPVEGTWKWSSGCTSKAMDEAARNGHLLTRLVKWVSTHSCASLRSTVPRTTFRLAC